MIDTRVVKDESGTIDLCETFTNDESKVLLQSETGVVYGQSAIDLIAGYYMGSDKPYSRFTYQEVEKPEEQIYEREEPVEV